jgi:hypothetical protein
MEELKMEEKINEFENYIKEMDSKEIFENEEEIAKQIADMQIFGIPPLIDKRLVSYDTRWL